MPPAREPQRSPRAQRNEEQARVTKVILGVLVLGVLGAAGLGVSWLRKRAEARRDAEDHAAREAADLAALVESAASRPETAPSRPASAPATSRPARPPSDYRPDATIADIRAKYEDGSVEGVWQATQAIRAEAAAWKAEGAPDVAVNRLLAAVLDSETWILKTRPAFPELRTARGEVRFPEVMGDYEDLDTRFLTKAEAARLARSLQQFEMTASSNWGWISKADYSAVAGPLVLKALEGRKAFDAMLLTASGRAAREVEIRDLAELKTLFPRMQFRAFYHLPYLVLVEQDDGWEEDEPARELARTLLGLRKTFFELYGGSMGLKPANQRVVSVLLFKSREGYHLYAAKRGLKDVIGHEAHYEPRRLSEPPIPERLVLHHDCAPGAILHEGTHQLLRANIRTPLESHGEAFWFHEGFAEWFRGSRPLADGEDGLPRFEVGLLMPDDLAPGPHQGPISLLHSTPLDQRIPLEQLAGIMLSDRELFAAQGKDGLRKIDLVYAEGWFLIYFLNHFAVSDAGVVLVSGTPRYRDVFLDYLGRELEGQSGSAAFLAALASAKVSLAQVEKDMNAYLAFVARKLSKGQFRDQRLIPWSETPRSDSRPAATADDDRLSGR
jgi:hypothetical protein